MVSDVSNIFEIFDMWGVTCSSRISLRIDIPTLPVAVSPSAKPAVAAALELLGKGERREI